MIVFNQLYIFEFFFKNFLITQKNASNFPNFQVVGRRKLKVKDREYKIKKKS